MIAALTLQLFFVTTVISEDKLLHVHSLWRHGERNPRKLFNGDLNNFSDFPDGMGQLTKNGINQFYALGQKFQERYIKSHGLLSPKYQNSEVFARSTDIDRTIVSAMAFYSGLYSNSNDKNHVLTPVPIHTIPTSDEYLYLLRFQCNRMFELNKIVDKSQSIKTLLHKHHDLLSKVANETRMPLSYYESIFVFDTVTLEKLYGLPTPTWITPNMSKEFDQLFVDYVSTQYGFRPFPSEPIKYPFNLQLELSKMSSGMLIAEISDRLILKTKCEKQQRLPECATITNQKLYTYSGHDITVVSLFGGLGFKNFTFDNDEITLPSFGSSIILELWEDENAANSIRYNLGHYYIKILYYQNANVEEPKNIGSLLPECQGKEGCPLGYLIQRSDLLRPKPDLKTFCNTPIMSMGSRYGYSILPLLMSMIIKYCIF